LASLLTLTDEEQALKERVNADYSVMEERHKSHRPEWERYYGLYRSYREFADTYSSATPPGRDDVLRDAQDTWGAELFIPYVFSTIETILPRMLSNRPRMLVLPRQKDSEENAPKMRDLIDSQQERIGYELKLQKTAKSGLIYGLGVQKVFWRLEERQRKGLVVGPQGPMEGMVAAGTDDPDVENIDIFDFFWDPYASEIPKCRFVLHRTWRDHRYVMDRIKSGQWRELTEEDVRSLGPSAKYDEVMDSRMKSAGHRDWRSRGNQMHEVWEYWDQRDGIVVTMLDREIPVQSGEHPYWHGELPFVVYRPTDSGIEQLPGIGEVDPIEDLQREMNTLRRQRRDNAALKLAQVFAYAEGFVEPEDLVFFPGAAIETRGEPRDLLFPINVGDIPNSGYQEEANLTADIERTTGISDPVSGAGDASQTATGVQLVQAAANVRIQLKTRRLEAETAKPACRMFGSMNQQRILKAGEMQVRTPGPPQPGQAERRWNWLVLTPRDLMGEFDYEPEGGSTAPENVPQMRQDANQFMQLFRGNPNVDQRMVLEHSLTLFGVKQPAQWFVPNPVPQNLPEVLVQMGAPPDKVQEAIEQARELEQQQQDQPDQPEQGDGAA
jgi:hypothetical protein